LKLITKVLRLFIKLDDFEIIGELNRNDKCFCNSGEKFKNCHYHDLLQKKKNAYIVRDIKTNESYIKILKSKKMDSTRIKSNLRWEDIGGGGIGKIDP
jgi:hypothetical protein